MSSNENKKPTSVAKKIARIGCAVVGGFIALIVLIVVLVGVFSGNHASSPPANTSPSNTAPASTAVPVSKDDPVIKQAAYLATLRADGIRGTDADLINAGKATCTALDSGLSMSQTLMTAATASSLTPEQAGRVVGGAVFVWCPKYQPEIDKLGGR